MLKRKFTMIICLALILTLIASACSNNNNNTNNNNDTGESKEITFPITTGETISVATQMGIPQQDFFMEGGLPVLNEMEEQTGVKAEWDLLPVADWQQVIQTRLNAGSDLPDIVKVPG